jgi:hypothetical protein
MKILLLLDVLVAAGSCHVTSAALGLLRCTLRAMSAAAADLH